MSESTPENIIELMIEPTPELVSSDAAGNVADEAVVSPPAWQIVVTRARVDSFNQDQLMNELREARTKSTRMALDLRPNRFLSLPVIKFCVEMSRELATLDGSFVLIGCNEKTKRHFEIYGTLDFIRVVRSEVDLDRARRPRDV